MASHKSKSSFSRNKTSSRGATRKSDGRMAKSASQKNGRRTSHGPNHSRMVEFLSQMLAVEKGGVMLYEKALRELSDEALRDQLEEFLEQTKRHVELCEEMLEQAGGSADESSPAAEAAEKKAEGLMSVEVPEELVDFNNIENLVLAETKDNWNWECLAELSKNIKDRELRSTISGAVREVARQERKHVDWNSSTLTGLGNQMMMEKDEGEEGYQNDEAEERLD
jgi:rubrerythrin